LRENSWRNGDIILTIDEDDWAGHFEGTEDGQNAFVFDSLQAPADLPAANVSDRESLLSILADSRYRLLAYIADACLDDGRPQEARWWRMMARERFWPGWYRGGWRWTRETLLVPPYAEHECELAPGFFLFSPDLDKKIFRTELAAFEALLAIAQQAGWTSKPYYRGAALDELRREMEGKSS
jgi:hypothetical protein